jgi:CheY-like chemotaxis protein
MPEAAAASAPRAATAPLAPVLAAEDEETDRFILRLACEQAGLANPLVLVRDGEEALAYLQGRPPYEDRARHPLPALLVLDLKMPRRTGFEVLEWLATRPELARLPAVMLSSSPDESDMATARRLGAREYFVKPHSLSEFVAIIRSVRERWLDGGQAT